MTDLGKKLERKTIRKLDKHTLFSVDAALIGFVVPIVPPISDEPAVDITGEGAIEFRYAASAEDETMAKEIKVYDHREATKNAVVTDDILTIAKALNSPARVKIKVKKRDDVEIHFINLYPIEGPVSAQLVYDETEVDGTPPYERGPKDLWSFVSMLGDKRRHTKVSITLSEV